MAFGPDHPDFEDWLHEKKYSGAEYVPTPDEIEAACVPLRPIKELELMGVRGVGTPMRHMSKQRLFVTSGNKRFYL